jgi:hypothetical protein
VPRRFFLKSKSLGPFRLSSAPLSGRGVFARRDFDLAESSGISRYRRTTTPVSTAVFQDYRVSCSAWPQDLERGDITCQVDRAALCGAAPDRQSLDRGRPPVRWVSNQQNHAERVTVPEVIDRHTLNDSARRSVAKRLDADTRNLAGAIRAGVWGTRPTTECPQPTQAVAGATASSPGRPDRLPGVSALSLSAPAAIVTRAPSPQTTCAKKENSEHGSWSPYTGGPARASSLSES